MEQMTLAERLAALRKKAGLSQAEVAAKLSLSRQAVSKWESGKGLPSLITYSVLSTLYDVSIDLLLLGEEIVEPIDLPATNGKNFPEALREVRRHRKISQEAMAQSLSVSRQSVSKWESGKAEPDADHLIALAKLLDVSLSVLLPTADGVQPPPKAPVSAPQPKPVKAEISKPIEKPKVAPKVEIPAPAPAPAPKVVPISKPAPQVQPKPKATDAVSRRQKLQERVRLAGQKERAAKAALGIKKK